MASSFQKHRTLHIALAAVSLLEGLLLGIPPVFLPIFVALGWFALYKAVVQLRQVNFRQQKALLIASAGLAVLFCAMLPITWLTDRDQLYNLVRRLDIASGLLRWANLIDNLLTVGLTSALIFVFISGLWANITCRDRQPLLSTDSRQTGWRSIVFYSFPCLLVWAVFLYAYWPGVMLPDSYEQWQMIYGLLPLADAHPITHTLIEALLLHIWDTPAAVAIFQITALALTWGWAMTFFEAQNISPKILFPLSLLFALLPYNGIQMVTLLKDELYVAANLGLIVLLGKIWVSGGDWLERRRNQVVFGISLALPYLLRHNGLLILLLIPLALLLGYRRAWKAVATAVVLSMVLVVSLRNGLGFGLLKVEASPFSVIFEVPIQHISAVGFYGGTYTDEQAKILEHIAPLQTWRSAYKPYFADSLTKPWGVTEDEKIYEKIDREQNGLLRTFVQLSAKYPLTILRSELDLMSMVWMVTFPEKERPWVYEYSTASYKPPSNLDAAKFYQPNQGTPVNAALTAYLRWSSGPADAILWRGGLYLFASLALMGILFFARGWRSLILFMPTIANIFSLSISMPNQSFRYIYPIVICVPLLALFAFVRRKAD